jgi:hypothetical protein
MESRKGVLPRCSMLFLHLTPHKELLPIRHEL